MTMEGRLNILLPAGLLADLDALAKEQGCTRSELTRLALWRLLNTPESYVPPTLPNWQVEAWELLLNGLFGTTHLALIDAVRPMLIEAVAALNERDAQVLRLRFGLGGPQHTQTEVAAAMGWERQRAHQIERTALGRVRGWCRVRGIWEMIGEQLSKEEA